MAVDLVTVTGNLETLAGAAPLLGRVWFRISRADWTLSGEIFAPEYVEVIADAVTGAFSVDLQSTDDFEAGSTYAAVLKYREPLDAKDREFTIGTFALPSGGPYQLGDLMSVPVAAPVPADVLALCQAYAAATAADRVQTGLDRDATEAARADAVAAAAQAALYDGPWLDDVAALLADTSLTYTTALPGTVVAGDYVQTRAEGFAYQVAASGASDQHVTTAGGVKLYVQAGDAGYNVKAFGAVGDGSADDTAAIQKAVNAGVTNRRSVFIPRTSLGSVGLHRITSPITVSGRVRIYGEGTNYSGVVCTGCSGFQIAAGVNNVTIEKLFIGQAVRYSTTPNTYKAIETLGTTGSRNFWHIYRDLFIDGFEWAMQFSYTWSTVINSVTGVFCFGGVYGAGLSVNNFVSNCSFGGSKTAGSAGIKIGDGATATEGWMIQDSLLAEFDTGVWGLGASNCHVRGCIIDFFQENGVLLQSSATAGAQNWTVSENYMATDNAVGANGVRLKNDFAAAASSNRGHRISGNQILKYSGAGLSYGIAVDGTEERGYVITENRIDATSFACRLFTGTNGIVSNNYWMGGSFSSAVAASYVNNRGTVSSSAYPSPQGVFTPVVVGSSTAGVGTYTVQYGSYKIIDNICYFTLRVHWTAHTGAGALRIAGLPVITKLLATDGPPVTVNAESLTFPASTTSIIGFVRAGESGIELRGSGSGTGPTAVAMDTAASIAISGFYEVG